MSSPSPRTVAVVTSSRADYSSCRPILRGIAAEPALAARLLVTGSHLADEFGRTVTEIEADGLAPDELIESYAGPSAADAARTVGLTAAGVAASFERLQPALALVVGDRLELLGVAAATVPFRIPLAHVSGGDVTGGAIDDVVRAALSKLAHLHFVAMEEHAQRLVAMGEERWRITVSGDPALDEVGGPWPARGELERELGFELGSPLVVVGFHPATLGTESPAREIDELLAALDGIAGTILITYPGADVGADEIVERIESFAAAHPAAVVRPSLGQSRYYAVLAHADVLVGNTSSGIWEAPSFRLPVVNVGERQRGRRRAANVIDVPAERSAIADAVHRALAPSFRATLAEVENPYGDGHATERIVAVLRDVELGQGLLAKAPPG